MRKIFFIFVFVFLPLPLSAKESFSVLASENELKIAGSCAIDVRIALSPVGNDEEIAYSSGVRCEDGEFSFSDDLARWNIPDGQYTLWVNGDPSTKRAIVKKIVTAPLADLEQEAVVEEMPPKNRFEQAMDDFGKSLGTMSISLGIIEENLSSSDYAGDTMKRVLVGFLRTTLDTLSVFFGDFKEERTKERPSDMVVPEEVVPTPPAEEPLSVEESIAEESSESAADVLQEGQSDDLSADAEAEPSDEVVVE